MKFIAAISYLTVLPLPWRLKARPVTAAEMAWLFPVVGLIMGLALAGMRWFFGLILPPAVANALIIAALTLATGMRHLGGLAHTADGAAGIRMGKARLQIMEDSNIGSFGIAAICGLLLLKYIALNNLPAYWVMPALVLAPTTARWALTYVMYIFPRVEPATHRRGRRRGTGGRQLAAATVFSFVIAAMLIMAEGSFPTDTGERIISLVLALSTALAVMLIAAAIISAFGYWLCRRLPGLTEHTDGAVIELAETLGFILVGILGFLTFS